MAQTNLCRLCVDICHESKSLYDDNGLGNELYKITYKYFHPTIVNMEEAKHLATICLSCWQYIWDFHNFQTSVQVAQCKLKESKLEALNTVVKSETVDKPIEIYNDSRDSPPVDLLVDRISQNEEPLVRNKPIEELDDQFMAHDPPVDHLVDRISQDEEPLVRNKPIEELDDQFMANDNDFVTEASKVNESSDDVYTNPRMPAGVDGESSSDDDIQSLSKSQPPRAVNTAKISMPTKSPSCVNSTSKKRTYQKLDDLLAKWMPTIKCVACTASFTKLKLLEDHFRSSHTNDEFYISCCSRRLTKRFRIKEHLMLHSDPHSFTCVLCQRSYSSAKWLKRHITRHHPEVENIKFVCKICGKGLETKWGLKSHYGIVHKIDVTAEELSEISSADKNTIPGESIVSNAEHSSDFDNNEPLKLIKVKLEKELTLDSETFLAGIPGSNQGCTVNNCTISSAHSVTGESSLRLKGTAVPHQSLDSLMEFEHPKLEIMDVATESEISSEDEISISLEGQESSPDQNGKLDDLLTKWMPSIKCVACPQSYSNLDSLQEHFSKKHPNEEFYILCCSRKLGKRLQIKHHLLRHDNPDSLFKCEHCPRSFSTKKSLKRHQGRRHPEKQNIKFMCNICGFGVRTKGGLKIHHKTMHRTAELPEEVIQLNEYVKARKARKLERAPHKAYKKTVETFKIKDVVSLQEKQPESPPTDPLNDTLETVPELNNFFNDSNPCQDMPNDGDQYTCRICEYKTKNKIAYYKHMWFIHKTKLKFLCTYCGRIYKRTRDLLEHVAIHQNRDIYSCAFCPKTFRKMVFVIAHRREEHPQESNKKFYTKIE